MRQTKFMLIHASWLCRLAKVPRMVCWGHHNRYCSPPLHTPPPLLFSAFSAQCDALPSVCRGPAPYPHTAPVHTEAHWLGPSTNPPPHHHHHYCIHTTPLPPPPAASTLYPVLPCRLFPSNLALRRLVDCGTRTVLCCVSGGNASPLSSEQLFDDGPCCASLWFRWPSKSITGPRLQPKWPQCHRVQDYTGLTDLWTDRQMQVSVEKRASSLLIFAEKVSGSQGGTWHSRKDMLL